MDWVWTDTTLSLSDWMCVEDIYANIFIIKCNREMEKVGLHGRGGSMVELGLRESSQGFHPQDNPCSLSEQDGPSVR